MFGFSPLVCYFNCTGSHWGDRKSLPSLGSQATKYKEQQSAGWMDCTNTGPSSRRMLMSFVNGKCKAEEIQVWIKNNHFWG